MKLSRCSLLPGALLAVALITGCDGDDADAPGKLSAFVHTGTLDASSGHPTEAVLSRARLTISGTASTFPVLELRVVPAGTTCPDALGARQYLTLQVVGEGDAVVPGTYTFVDARASKTSPFATLVAGEFASGVDADNRPIPLSATGGSVTLTDVKEDEVRGSYQATFQTSQGETLTNEASFTVTSCKP